MGQRLQLFEQPLGEARHPRLHGLHTYAVEQVKAMAHGGDHQVVDRAVFEGRLAVGHEVVVRQHRRDLDRAPGEPRAIEFEELVSFGDQGADTGREPEHLVEAEARIVGVELAEVEGRAGREGGAVDEHVPPEGVGLVDEVERVFHPREVRLGRECEEPITVAMATVPGEDRFGFDPFSPSAAVPAGGGCWADEQVIDPLCVTTDPLAG